MSSGVGIEKISFYLGKGFVDIKKLAIAKGFYSDRFDKLLMEKKSVSFPVEDPVTFGVNAAKPLIDKLSSEEKRSIIALVTASESGIDFGKSISTYSHQYLQLPNACRLFEIKQACYGGTAAIQCALGMVLAAPNEDAKVLVICTDVALNGAAGSDYGEASQGAGAIALLIGKNPKAFEVELGKFGLHSYEVQDAFRPSVDLEIGDPELSLMSYLDCLCKSYENYLCRAPGTDLLTGFDFLCFHTPFTAMVKGAHRTLLRKNAKLELEMIEKDFQKRVTPSLKLSGQVGNLYSGALYLALISLCKTMDPLQTAKIGLFSYGSGCSSEFYSLNKPAWKENVLCVDLEGHLSDRIEIEPLHFDNLKALNGLTRNASANFRCQSEMFESAISSKFRNQGLLMFKGTSNYKREYIWS